MNITTILDQITFFLLDVIDLSAIWYSPECSAILATPCSGILSLLSVDRSPLVPLLTCSRLDELFLLLLRGPEHS
jgi:hypothetical protein